MFEYKTWVKIWDKIVRMGLFRPLYLVFENGLILQTPKLNFKAPKLVFKMQKLVYKTQKPVSPAFSMQVLGWIPHKEIACSMLLIHLFYVFLKWWCWCSLWNELHSIVNCSFRLSQFGSTPRPGTLLGTVIFCPFSVRTPSVWGLTNPPLLTVL